MLRPAIDLPQNTRVLVWEKLDSIAQQNAEYLQANRLILYECIQIDDEGGLLSVHLIDDRLLFDLQFQLDTIFGVD